MTKLLAYEVHVYLAPCPHHACDGSTSYSYCTSGFYSAGDSLTSYSYFCHVPDQVPTGDPPWSSSDRSPDPDSVLPDRFPHQGRHRGLAAAAFWLSSAVPDPAWRTDVSLLSDRDIAETGSPGL